VGFAPLFASQGRKEKYVCLQCVSLVIEDFSAMLSRNLAYRDWKNLQQLGG